MRLKMLAAAALFAFPALASAGNLMDVYDVAVREDPTLDAARHARDASLQARPQARSSLLPQLSADWSKAQGNSQGTTSSPSVDESTGETITLVQDYDSNSDSRSLSVSLTQSIFDWSAIETWRQSSDYVALAEVTYRAAEQDLIYRTAEAYFGILAASDDLRFAQAQEASLERQLEQAKKRFEVGLSAITDVQEVQASYDSAKSDVITAQQALEYASDALTEIINRKLTSPAPLKDDIPLVGPQPADVSSWINSALAGNLDLEAATIDTEISRKDISIARAGHYPTVSLRAGYDDSNSSGQSKTSDTTSNSITLTVDVPLFSGGYTHSKVVAADATHQQRISEQEASRRSVERTTRNAYLGVLAGAANVKALKQAVVSNKTALDASETGLQVGTRTSVDVLTAQSNLYSALRDYAQARYTYLLSILALKQASGSLNPADLREIDALLIQK